jgi:hypothetical protein
MEMRVILQHLQHRNCIIGKPTFVRWLCYVNGHLEEGVREERSCYSLAGRDNLVFYLKEKYSEIQNQWSWTIRCSKVCNSRGR